METLKEILQELKDEIDEDFFKNLFEVIDKTANVVILHLQEILIN